MADIERRRRRSRHAHGTGAANGTDMATGPASARAPAGPGTPVGPRTSASAGAPGGTAAAGTAAAGAAPGRGTDGSISTADVHDPESVERRRPPADDRDGERGLRGLVGSGSSQVGVGAALRARDAARPTDRHLAEAEANLTMVRRNWVPRDELPRSGRRD
ncbi:hypothetical protein [Plantactinospora sp. GCM10030261]|uniref:hypothetical protein n=1 Tax=Plantactinospora sp. GCM10030261 TaxID=3273420 RepID=UPI0036183535